jgi:hypothetical protein
VSALRISSQIVASHNLSPLHVVLLRDPAEKETGAISLGGEKKIVEYDTWINREDKYAALERGFGWEECSSSIFVPCKTTDKTGLTQPRRTNQKKGGKKAEKPRDPEEIQTEAGFDANANVDFFWDLEDDVQKGRPGVLL